MDAFVLKFSFPLTYLPRKGNGLRKRTGAANRVW